MELVVLLLMFIYATCLMLLISTFVVLPILAVWISNRKEIANEFNSL